MKSINIKNLTIQIDRGFFAGDDKAQAVRALQLIREILEQSSDSCAAAQILPVDNLEIEIAGNAEDAVKKVLVYFYWADDVTKHVKMDIAAIGEWDGKEDDKDSEIFYYFEDEADLVRCKEPDEEDFVIVDWRYVFNSSIVTPGGRRCQKRKSISPAPEL